MTVAPTAEPLRASAVPWLVGAGVAVLSVVLVLLSPLVDQQTLRSEADQRNMGFGLPYAWLHQDQSTLDPPFPWREGPLSPWEHPTSVSVPWLVADVALVLVVSGAVVLFAGILPGRVRRRPFG